MKKIVLLFVFFLLSLNVLADVSVKGYYRQSGTYVHPYQRSTTAKDTKNVSVKGYYRKSGAYVHPYHRVIKVDKHSVKVTKPN